MVFVLILLTVTVMRTINELIKSANKYFIVDDNTKRKNVANSTELGDVDNASLNDELMNDIFYKSLSEGKADEGLKYFSLCSDRSVNETRLPSPINAYSSEETDVANDIRRRVSNNCKRRNTGKESDGAYENDMTLAFDESLNDMLNEEECARKQKEIKESDKLRNQRDLDNLPKPIATIALFSAVYSLIDCNVKRSMFLRRVDRFSTSICSDFDELNVSDRDDALYRQLNEQSAFNSPIKDIFVRRETANVYETYFYSLLLPKGFGIKPSLKLTSKIPFANYALNFLRKTLGSYVRDVAIQVTRIGANCKDDCGDDDDDDDESSIDHFTLKSLIVLCAKGDIFKRYDLVKDVTETKFLRSCKYQIGNIIGSPTVEKKIKRFIENIMRYSFYSLFLTCINEHLKRIAVVKDEIITNASETLPLNETYRERCALAVYTLLDLPESIFLKNKDAICIHFKMDDLYYDHREDTWYWFDGKTVNKSPCLPALALKIVNR